MRALLRSKITWTLAVLAVALGAVALWAFEPWRAFTRSTADEALPSAPAASAGPAGTGGPRELASGAFTGLEHDTAGTARVLELGDGSHVLRLEGFSTSDGPDVHVWVTDTAADADAGAYDDGRTVPLGELEATDGNQNYEIPGDTDLDGLRSVVIWCDRFNVAFGSAPLSL